jgi:hypothetical protein
MPHPQQLQSEIIPYIKGIENVHCVVGDSGKTRGFWTGLFGEPKHQDGTWSEFSIGGLDVAVTGGAAAKSVITIRVENLAGLHSLLKDKGYPVTGIQHGDYGDFAEVSPDEGFAFHFFEPKNKCASSAG